MTKWDLFQESKSSSILKSINETHCISRTEGKKTYMIISLNAEKHLTKFQHSPMIKTLRNLKIEGNFLNSIQDIYEKATANIILNGDRLKNFPFKIRMPAFTTIIQHCTGSSSQSNQIRKRNKKLLNWKEVKLSLFADDKVLYIKKPKESIRKLLELKTEFNKISGYYINT